MYVFYNNASGWTGRICVWDEASTRSSSDEIEEEEDEDQYTFEVKETPVEASNSETNQ